LESFFLDDIVKDFEVNEQNKTKIKNNKKNLNRFLLIHLNRFIFKFLFPVNLNFQNNIYVLRSQCPFFFIIERIT